MREKLIWIGVAALLLVPTLLVASREVGANATRGRDQVVRFEMAAKGDLPNPLSYTGERQILLDCMEMADGLYARLQGKDALKAIAMTCAYAADRAMVSNPYYGFAALVRARMASIDEDWPRMNQMLRLSQIGAGSEQWVSVERLKLYTRYEERIENETLAARDADIALLLESPVGIKSIAKLYVENENLRTLIANEAEKRSEKVQARLVNVLKSVLASRGSR